LWATERAKVGFFLDGQFQSCRFGFSQSPLLGLAVLNSPRGVDAPEANFLYR
jgi:hypothetical protein